ncbi:15798_t:CDS:2 [Funneliformis mosseae]|uniref:15798_t:CDS:1 n=1 Tax=Funneliformis mosseae TaxID=27381 RepID=A0A9N9EZG7_FUNMO|nr:15798_t:CDS:2 [Funneliformis mosseae]
MRFSLSYSEIMIVDQLEVLLESDLTTLSIVVWGVHPWKGYGLGSVVDMSPNLRTFFCGGINGAQIVG